MSDFPFLLVMIALPAVGAAVVAALPKGRDVLAKQIALGRQPGRARARRPRERSPSTPTATGSS